jgi:hypothetical protein
LDVGLLLHERAWTSLKSTCSSLRLILYHRVSLDPHHKYLTTQRRHIWFCIRWWHCCPRCSRQRGHIITFRKALTNGPSNFIIHVQYNLQRFKKCMFLFYYSIKFLLYLNLFKNVKFLDCSYSSSLSVLLKTEARAPHHVG